MPPENGYDSKTKTMHIQDLGQGLHTDVNLFDIPSGGCAACSNVVWSDGYLRARPGLASIYSPYPWGSEALCHLALYTDFASNVTLMAVTRPTSSTLNVYKYTTSWAVVASGLAGDSDIPITSCNFKGYWYMTTGGGDMYRYDGTTWASVQSLQPTARFKLFDRPRIVVAGDSRLFVAGCYTSKDGTASGDFVSYRVAWSDFLLGEVWGGGTGGGSSGYVDLAQDSAPISGLYYSNSSLLAFKPNSIYIGFAAGPPKTFDFRQFVSGVGCISHQTIKRFREGQILWLGDDDVYLGGPGVTPTPLGSRIRPRIRSTVDLANIKNSLAVIDQQYYLYHLILPSAASGRNDKLFTVNLRNGSWWEGALAYPSIDVKAAVEFRLSPWRARQLMGTAAGGVFEFDLSNTTDAGTSFSCSWRTGMAAVRKLSSNQAEQATIEHIRIQALQHLTSSVSLAALHGDGMDRMTTTTFGLQVVDGAADLMTSARPWSAEHFQLQLSANGEQMPSIAEVGVAFKIRSQTHRRA